MAEVFSRGWFTKLDTVEQKRIFKLLVGIIRSAPEDAAVAVLRRLVLGERRQRGRPPISSDEPMALLMTVHSLMELPWHRGPDARRPVVKNLAQFLVRHGGVALEEQQLKEVCSRRTARVAALALIEHALGRDLERRARRHGRLGPAIGKRT